MRDLRPAYWIGIPIGTLVLCAIVAIVDPQAYKICILKHETGYLDKSTPALLAPAIVCGLIVLRRRRELPGSWIGYWATLLTVGAIYFAGEECSWGQNYFGWSTPEHWAEINR